MVSTLALVLTSCGSAADKRCVDSTNYKTVADSLCKSTAGGGYADTDRYQWYQKGGTSTYVGGYHRYYGSGSSSHVGSSSGGSDDGTSGSTGGKGVSRGGLGGHGSGSHGG
ncbi:hypothetical protein [Streptacidiphilus sp. PAMC 29251]